MTIVWDQPSLEDIGFTGLNTLYRSYCLLRRSSTSDENDEGKQNVYAFFDYIYYFKSAILRKLLLGKPKESVAEAKKKDVADQKKRNKEKLAERLQSGKIGGKKSEHSKEINRLKMGLKRGSKIQFLFH
jgi:hypothetical protein